MKPCWDGLLLDCRLATMTRNGAPYGLIERGALAWKDGRIVHAGAQDALPGAAAELAAQVDSAAGLLVTPGLVDCHTHLVFADNRAGEFEQRLDGAGYEDIAASGGGIMSSVRATRAADGDALFAQSLPRARALHADGVTTLEIKSGYGLDLGNEMKMLRVARRIGLEPGIDVRTTLLAAHALPPDHAGRADGYIDDVCSSILPAIAREGLADAVDAFCERIAFTPAQTRRVFAAARDLGLRVKLHADQLSDLGGAALAAEFGALSADHLEHASEAGIRAIERKPPVARQRPHRGFRERAGRRGQQKGTNEDSAAKDFPRGHKKTGVENSACNPRAAGGKPGSVHPHPLICSRPNQRSSL